MIELRFYLVALACAFWKQFNELLALVVPKHNALSVSRCRDVLGRTKKAEEFLLDFHEGGTAQAHRRGDLTQIDRFAVLLPSMRLQPACPEMRPSAPKRIEGGSSQSSLAPSTHMKERSAS